VTWIVIEVESCIKLGGRCGGVERNGTGTSGESSKETKTESTCTSWGGVCDGDEGE
jgi:hypothetical protein